jgi:hypothetical protein
MTTAMKQYTTVLGKDLELARAAIKTPLDENILNEIQEEVAAKIPMALNETSRMTAESMSGFSKSMEGLAGTYYKPLLAKVQEGKATIGDLIAQYKLVSEELAIKGTDDLAAVAQAATGNVSASKIAGDILGLSLIKKSLKDKIGALAGQFDDVKLANDLANKYSDLKDLEPFLNPASKTLMSATGSKVAEGVAPKPLLGQFVGLSPVAATGQAVGVANKIAAGRNAVSGDVAASLQNRALPQTLSLMSQGQGVPQMSIPSGLRAGASDFMDAVAPVSPAISDLIFDVKDTYGQGMSAPMTPKFSARAGAPGSRLADISVALSKENPGQASQITDRLQEAMSSGSEVEQNKVMGAVLMSSPAVRAMYEPGITPAKSEYGGIIADNNEKMALIGQVRQLMKAGRLSTIEGSNFVEKLNTDTPFEAVPTLLRRKTDSALAPLVDPYSFVTPQPPK